MQMNERVAAIAAYYMARFDSNLGYETQAEAFLKIEGMTGISRDRIRASMRDVFDYWFPWRNGWAEADKKKIWQEDLKEIYCEGNKLSEVDLKKTLEILGIWGKL